MVFDKTGLQIAALLDKPIGKRTLGFRSDFVSRALAGETLVSVPFLSGVDVPDSGGKMKPDQATLFVANPVRNDSDDIIGALAFRLRPSLGFTQVLEAGRTGETGEAYAFNAQGRLISESRFVEQLQHNGGIPETADSAILRFRLSDPGGNLLEGYQASLPQAEQPLTHMAANAVKGEEGINLDGYRDYRGVPVVGLWTWLEAYGFGIAVEMDVLKSMPH